MGYSCEAAKGANPGFGTALLTIAGVTVPVAQESEGSATSTVPIVLDTAGLNGSFFSSELTLTNRGLGNAIVDIFKLENGKIVEH